ncbi:ABC transporter substrate-binding protein [Actinomadura sp. WMMA1423]|uniref:ABC transporter substrate-binding protein n=1 Tax=Actinomadura sp. WMMA1423 TaxID=2591108 RepID=UPI001146F0AE|nr:extracellular solute-binding protein [Actinomadura sp. WMMA1423]
MRRTILGALGALTATAVLTSCSNSAGGTGSDTLRIASNSSEKAALDATVAAFEKANPGIKVNVTYADTDPYLSTLRTQLSSGTAADVFFTFPAKGNAGSVQLLAPAGYLEDLSGRSWPSKVPQDIKSVTQSGGKQYMLPVTFTGIGAVYNKKAFSEVKATEPTTWTQVLALCDKAKTAGKVAFALGNQTPWVTQLIDYALVSTLVYGQNPAFDSEQAAGRATFAGSAWKSAMNQYLDMNKRGCFSKDPDGTSVDAAVKQVAQGKALAAVQVLATAAQIKETAQSGTELGMFPLPATDDPSATRMPGAVGSSYAVNAMAKNKEAAEKFIDFLATPQAMNDYAAKSNAAAAITNPSFTPDPAFKALIDYQKAGRTVPFMDQMWPNPKVQQTHLSGVQDLFAGKATPQDVLNQMDKAYKND